MSDEESAAELDLDINECRGNEWVNVCSEALGTEKGINHMRNKLKIWKRKGGEGKTPGNYDALFDKLKTILGVEENEKEEDKEEGRKALTQLLEGTGDDFSDFSIA